MSFVTVRELYTGFCSCCAWLRILSCARFDEFIRWARLHCRNINSSILMGSKFWNNLNEGFTNKLFCIFRRFFLKMVSRWHISKPHSLPVNCGRGMRTICKLIVRQIYPELSAKLNPGTKLDKYLWWRKVTIRNVIYVQNTKIIPRNEGCVSRAPQSLLEVRDRHLDKQPVEIPVC